MGRSCSTLMDGIEAVGCQSPLLNGQSDADLEAELDVSSLEPDGGTCHD